MTQSITMSKQKLNHLLVVELDQTRNRKVPYRIHNYGTLYFARYDSTGSYGSYYFTEITSINHIANNIIEITSREGFSRKYRILKDQSDYGSFARWLKRQKRKVQRKVSNGTRI